MARPPDYTAHSEQMALFREEQTRREAVQVSRADQISTRAGVLIGSASITAALRVADQSSFPAGETSVLV